MVAYDELRASFAAAVSHELRTPLARILILLESALLPNADVPGIVDRARQVIRDASLLIEDVLTLSRLETAEALGGHCTPLLPLARDVVAALVDEAAEGGVTIRLRGNGELCVPARESLMRLLLRNLVDNAIRHAGAGATLTLGVVARGGSVELSAADDGAGVPDEALPRLFERFYRADESRASTGSGLGLAIVKHVAVAVGGRVEARAASGRGLVVTCTLPRCQARGAGSGPLAQPHDPGFGR